MFALLTQKQALIKTDAFPSLPAAAFTTWNSGKFVCEDECFHLDHHLLEQLFGEFFGLAPVLNIVFSLSILYHLFSLGIHFLTKKL